MPSPEREVPELAAHPALLRFVARATVKDRTGRAQSAGELLSILDGREGGRATPRHGPAHPEPPRRRGPRPVTSLFWPVTSGLPRARTLTLLATEIDGWGERAEALPPEERARLLLAHDRLVIPALHAFEGRRALVAGEALTADFALAHQRRALRHGHPGPGGGLERRARPRPTGWRCGSRSTPASWPAGGWRRRRSRWRWPRRPASARRPGPSG